MRLKSFPVAFRMLEKKGDLHRIPFMRRMEHPMTLCQMITLVRNFDWTVGAEAEDFITPVCSSIIGLGDTSEYHRDGTIRSIVWFRTRGEARKYEASIPRLPAGKYEAVAMAPLVYNPFEPDIVLIYANPAQMMLLINSLQFEDYEVMQFFCVGESSCSDAIARCYLTGKPSLTIPCYGERRYGHAQDEDLVMAVPAGMMEKALRGMESLYRRGIRYPISFAGAEQDLTRAFPMSYGGWEELDAIRGKDNRVLLGVTGGIATGKTTVVQMLEDLGAPVIDFDVLARDVVEPGKPAWKDIVSFFGEQVLQEDKGLDRKRLSDIVFRDMEKRKRLEGFTHPRINEEFVRRVNEIAAKDPDAIIQVDIPLLIEHNYQHYFHRLLVVYVPREVQIERLIKRDGITREQAENILRAQLPIDEKVGYADFVIHNEGSLEETRRQVDALWKELREAQRASRAQEKGE
ncbi:MAG: dephospho-CoA kinase [Deltaproteobacteria bacterium]|nr:dephospho-CoA kinase [Deltaproteobacteria bacterium]